MEHVDYYGTKPCERPLKRRVTGRGIYILYEDVKSCPYEDVHVLWSILVESNSPSLPSKRCKAMATV
ncbi:hypothetical protein TanjilG_07186 [Lupinus angustifolius]|uniref:Uncharacterized protein n=1 Tax=Lupinus angustifolius TaxID=3871 RepID=A0A1J7IMB5_LUPAN|nr:hypothetical protein TanjilG_07186 [Lupinus angustifolius]